MKEKMISEVTENESILSSPRFDETTAASAQPVERLPKRGDGAWAAWIENIRSRALVLVIIAGLATGALGGMWWARESSSTELRPANESVSGLPEAARENEELTLPISGAAAWQSSVSNTTRFRRNRSRARSSGAPRAYRVAVIR